MYEGKEFQLTADGQRVTWTSSDTSKATVDSNGKVKAKKKGTVTITAEKSGEKHSCEIKIKKQSFIDKLRGIAMNATAVTLYEGENIVLQTGQTGEWKTTNKYAAEVASGRVGGKKAGIAIISQKIEKKTVTCVVTVKKYKEEVETTTVKVEKVEEVELNPKVATLEKGSNLTLTAEVKPDNAVNKELTWKSSDTKVATVDSNGKVTAKAAGTSIITATAKDGSGKSGICMVTVTEPVIKVSKITLNQTVASIEKGKELTLTATVSPNNATNKQVEWKSSNTNIATVDSNGKVKAKAEGEATITAKAKDGSNKCVECKVTVIGEKLKISGNATKIGIGETVTLSANKSGVTWSIHAGGEAVEVRDDHQAGEAKYVAKKLGSAIIKATKGSETAYYTITVATDIYTNADYQEIYNYTGYNTNSWASFSKLNSDYVIAIGNKKLNAVMKDILDENIYQDAGTGKGKCNRLASYYCYLLTDQISEASISKSAATAFKYQYDAGKDNIGKHKNEGHLQVIKNWIDQGKPVKLHVVSNTGGHWVTVVGYKKGECNSYDDLLILGVTFGTLQTVSTSFNETYGGINSDKDAKVFN
jgi:uncharacterized protein YjdB